VVLIFYFNDTTSVSIAVKNILSDSEWCHFADHVDHCGTQIYCRCRGNEIQREMVEYRNQPVLWRWPAHEFIKISTKTQNERKVMVDHFSSGLYYKRLRS